MQQTYEASANLAALKDHPANPRRGDDDAVAESVEATGFYGAVIAQRSTGFILAGHTRRRVLLARGQEVGPVLWLDVDDTTAERILLADNRTAELATWDNAALAELLAELAGSGEDGLTGSGFGEEDLDVLQRQLGAANLGGSSDYDKEWDESGMPAYESTDLGSAFRTVVHFRTEEDADAFFKALDRPRKKSWWYPDGDGHVGLLSDQRVVAEAS